jgi:16S rRNA (cytidine1402-2'-O)-methyltransferase
VVLTLVATPIGNLEDLSPRAQRVLREADQIYAEDTRHTGQLLARLQIKTRLRSCHDHNEEQRSQEIVERLRAGERIALVSDAGTPGVADPGFRVVRAAVAAGLEVSMVPGPSSVIMALVLSGFPSDRFVFDGWLPRRSGRLARQLESYRDEERSVVLLESSHRLLKSLPHFREILGDRELAVCREMTKLHEEIRRGRASDHLRHYQEHPPKGELVLVLAGASA